MCDERTSVGHRRSHVAGWWARARLLVLVAIGVSCAPSTTTHWVPSTPWDAANRRDLLAQEAAIILQDRTDLRLASPRFDDGAVRGARITFCEGPRCEALERTLTVPRSEVVWLSLRYASADEVLAATNGASRAGTDAPWTGESASFPAEALRSEAPRARHALYLSGTSLFFSNGFGLTYSYRPMRAFAVSVGVGSSYLDVPCLCFSIFGGSCGCSARHETAIGGQIMMHLLAGGTSVNFEFGLGVAAVGTNSAFLDGSREERLAVYPSMFLGLRLQPVSGGFLLRVGVAWDYGLATGLSTSFGATF